MSREADNSPASVPERLGEAFEWVRPAPLQPRATEAGPDVPAIFVDVSVKDLAKWACVTENHARLLKSGQRSPSPAVEKLVRLHVAGRVVPSSWSGAGWSFDGSGGQEGLHGPDGLTFQPCEVLAIPFLQSALSAHRADQRRYREDAERAGDLRHAFDRLRSAFLQIGKSVADAERLLAAEAVGEESEASGDLALTSRLGSNLSLKR
jgi:hypothetical protein